MRCLAREIRSEMNATIVKQPARARLSRDELRRRWQRMIRDPMLVDIPGKLELNEQGTIELSPANNRHGILQAFVTRELGRLLPHGTTIVECSIETDIGVRVPDVAWATPDFMSWYGSMSPFPRAPELCIEVLSPSNTEPEMQQKTAAYLAAGATEVWLVKDDGTVEMLDARGRIAASSFGIAMEAPPR
jgi:Uma2 family endonuclease